MKFFTVLVAVFLFSPISRAATRNILMTGYWPPTNEMLRRFSPNLEKNPQGWIGKNFEGSGYDVYAFFPEFSSASSDSVGTGDFRVDYAAAYNDFMKYTGQFKPIAILSFGRGDGPWEIEALDLPYFLNMFRSGVIPSSIGVQALYPVPESLKEDVTYDSSLPMTSIRDRVNAIPGEPIRAWIDSTNGAGDYLCGFMAYLGGWYHARHLDPRDPAYNAMAGFIHVNGDLKDAKLAAVETLRAVVSARP